MGLDRFFAEAELAGGDRGRFAVGEQLQDLALAPGQLAAAAFRRHRRVDEAFLGERRLDGAPQLLGAGGAGDVGAGARLQGGAGEVALGRARRGRRSPCPGSALRSARIASWPLSAAPSPSWRQRRMSTIATSKLPTSRTSSTASLAAGRLVDLEVVVERFAHAEPDQRVAVDHKAMWALAQDWFRYLGVRRWRLVSPEPSAPILAQVRAVR